MSMKNHGKIGKTIILLSGLTSLTALLSLFQLISIPANPQNSVLFGFSVQRLVMIGFTLAILTTSLLMILWGINGKEIPEKWVERILRINSVKCSESS